MYIKPTSPTKSPTNTLSYNSIGAIRRKEVMNGSENGAKLLTTTVSYLKGASSKPPGTGGKMAWNKDVTPDKLSFTMKREFDKQKEETELLQQLRVVSFLWHFENCSPDPIITAIYCPFFINKLAT